MGGVLLDFCCKGCYAVRLADVQRCDCQVAVLLCQLLQLLRVCWHPRGGDDLVGALQQLLHQAVPDAPVEEGLNSTALVNWGACSSSSDSSNTPAATSDNHAFAGNWRHLWACEQ